MDLGHLQPDERQIVMDALATYSDACTAPNLTPSCPFYGVAHDGSATCEEECLEILKDLGVPGREKLVASIGGLKLVGRTIPVDAASGVASYDAAQNYLEDRNLPPKKQRTGSLLLGLQRELLSFPCAVSGHDVYSCAPAWSELESRGIPMLRVLAARPLRLLAHQMASLSILPTLIDFGLIDSPQEGSLLARIDHFMRDEWTPLIGDLIAHLGGEPQARALALAGGHRSRIILPGDSGPDFVRDMPQVKVEALEDEGVRDALMSDARIPLAASPLFINRISYWLSHLATSSIADLREWKVPPAALFVEMSDGDPDDDEEAQWIWDRFAVTSPINWARSSLFREWVGGAEPACGVDPRAWRERRLDQDELSGAALTHMASDQYSVQEVGQLGAEDFVGRASEKLSEGDYLGAAAIFEGLSEILPMDGDSLNNWGFCLIPVDPGRALEILERASLRPQTSARLNVCNRALALHLLGRDDEGLRVLQGARWGSTEDGGLFSVGSTCTSRTACR